MKLVSRNGSAMCRRRFLKEAGGTAVAAGMLRGLLAATPAKSFRSLFPISPTLFTPNHKLDLDFLDAQLSFCNRGKVL